LGRAYELWGKPGIDPDAGYVWKRWKSAACVTNEKDVTREYLPQVP
jgi:hypothetical protein